MKKPELLTTTSFYIAGFNTVDRVIPVQEKRGHRLFQFGLVMKTHGALGKTSCKQRHGVEWWIPCPQHWQHEEPTTHSHLSFKVDEHWISTLDKLWGLLLGLPKATMLGKKLRSIIIVPASIPDRQIEQSKLLRSQDSVFEQHWD